MSHMATLAAKTWCVRATTRCFRVKGIVDRVFCRSTITGTHDGEYKGIPATGRHMATECAEVFRVVDDRFVGYWCLTNVAGLMRQLTEEEAVAAAAPS